MDNKYMESAKSLSNVIDIAIDSIKQQQPKNWNTAHLGQFIQTYQDIKHKALNPEEKYENLKSLKVLQNDVFIFFQESSGEAVEQFWSQLKNKGLAYERKNNVLKILKRKKINNLLEYNFVKDVIVPYRQENLINADEETLLAKFLEDFENKKK